MIFHEALCLWGFFLFFFFFSLANVDFQIALVQRHKKLLIGKYNMVKGKFLTTKSRLCLQKNLKCSLFPRSMWPFYLMWVSILAPCCVPSLLVSLAPRAGNCALCLFGRWESLQHIMGNGGPPEGESEGGKEMPHLRQCYV